MKSMQKDSRSKDSCWLHDGTGYKLKQKHYILIFVTTIIFMIGAVCVYLNQLSNTVAANLMSSVEEISRHDVESIEGTLDNSYARLGSVAERFKVYDVSTVYEVQEQLNLEAASSALFNAVYLLDNEGNLYSSSYVQLGSDEHNYDQIFKNGADYFVMLYDDSNGRLETTKESLIYGLKLDNMVIGDRTYVAIMGRSDLSAISDQFLIESFDDQGISSVVNAQGYYIVSASPATDLAGRDNFYDMLEAGTLEDGVTIEDIRNHLSAGDSFVVNCINAQGEALVLSFAPVEGTTWSFIMAVPTRVFEQRFAPFITMTACMLAVVIAMLAIMMVAVYRFMKRSVLARAESAARAEFLSNMSHEIRTPLNGIIGLNHLMERHLDDRESMAIYVQKLGRTAQYLLSLVNDILDVSKLQAGKVELVKEPFNLQLAIDNVCEMQRESTVERGIDFDTSEISLSYPYLLGDEVRVSQVLMNILSNAIKFTPEQGKIVFAAHQEYNAGTHTVTTTLSIADTGCGMTKEFQAHIFDVFSQERNSNSESQKGTGLGMSICHLLVKQMGGTLELESELGVGSRFTVTLTMPLDTARMKSLTEDVSQAACGSSAAPEGSSLANGDMEQSSGTEKGDLPADDEGRTSQEGDTSQEILTLLVAEDNELNADIISSILTEEGYEIVIAANGQEALEIFTSSQVGEFAAILMDAQMPVMDGYESARAIRNLNRVDAKTIKIFACTASTFAEDRIRALESGMDDFLPKPLNVAMMLQKLDEVRRSIHG